MRYVTWLMAVGMMAGVAWAQTLDQQVMRLLGEKRYDEAEPIARQAVKVAEEQFGTDAAETAISLKNLAELYESQDRYSEAESLWKRVLAIREKALGPDDLATRHSLKSLAWLYESQGKYAEAEPLRKRLLAIGEKDYGPDHFLTACGLEDLARLYQSQGRYAEAEPLLQRALPIFEKYYANDPVYGPNSPGLSGTLNAIAVNYGAQGKYAEAEPLCKRALAMQEKVLGPDHPTTMATRKNLTVIQEGREAIANRMAAKGATNKADAEHGELAGEAARGIAPGLLGVTAKTCVERLGNAISVNRNKKANIGGLFDVDTDPSMTFKAPIGNGVTVQCFFSNAEPTSICHTVIYRGMQGDGAMLGRILASESQGSEWFEGSEEESKYLGTVLKWQREDGGSADYTGGVGLTIRGK